MSIIWGGTWERVRSSVTMGARRRRVSNFGDKSFPKDLFLRNQCMATWIGGDKFTSRAIYQGEISRIVPHLVTMETNPSQIPPLQIKNHSTNWRDVYAIVAGKGFSVLHNKQALFLLGEFMAGANRTCPKEAVSSLIQGQRKEGRSMNSTHTGHW